MFNNPKTIWIEIIAIAIVLTFLGWVVVRYIYRKKHHLPTGECEYCHKSKKQILKEYHKRYPKE